MSEHKVQQTIPKGSKVKLTGIHICDIDADGNPVFTYLSNEIEEE